MKALNADDDAFRETITALTGAIESNKDDFVAYINRALIYKAHDQYQNALSDVTRAILLNPQYANAYAILGALQTDAGNHVEAASCFAKAKTLTGTAYSKGFLPICLDADGDSGLHIAALYGDQETIGLLIKKGIDLNARNAENSTPLMMAVFGGHRAVVETLLANGSDVNARNNDGNTSLHFAVKDKDIVRVLLENQADPNVLNISHMLTPMEIAVFEGLPKVVELLIAAGSNPAMATDLNGMAKLHLAVLNSDSSLAKRLLRQGARINCKNKLGQTPLHLAILNGDIDICQLLLAKGAQSNAPDINGNSPIQLAINTGNDELFELLIACSTVG